MRHHLLHKHNNSHRTTPMSDTKLNLFVNEDEDMPDVPQDFAPAPESNQIDTDMAVDEDDDDPIIHTVPIFHSSVASRQSQTLHTFQFPGRPHNRTFEGQLLEALVKPISKVVELKVPMDTLKFYDESRTQELGARIDKVSLQGVLDATNENLYVGAIDVQDGKERIVLFPLDQTAQLRALFKYIDDVEAARTAQIRNENAASAPKPSAVQVLQTASKAPQGGANGPLAHGEGLCLKHIKQFNEELWEAFSWHESSEDSTRGLTEKMNKPSEAAVEVKSLFDVLLEELKKANLAALGLDEL